MRLITPPATFPVDLALVKTHLRIDHTASDTLLQQVIMPAAAGAIERMTKTALMPQTWEIGFDAFPSGVVTLPLGPVVSVDITYTDPAGDPQTYSGFNVDTYKGTVIVSGTAPEIQDIPNAVRIQWVAGVGCPTEVKQAFLLLTGHFYENREAAGEKVDEIPLGVQSLIARHRYSFSFA